MRKLFLGFVLTFLIMSARGQDLWKTKAAQQACGPESARYQKGDGLEEHPVLPAVPEGKALVYLVQRQEIMLGSCLGSCAEVVKFGLDGQWKGAVWGSSFVYAVVDPGDHHVCASLDTRVKKLTGLIALDSLHVEAGKTYVFGTVVTTHGGESGLYRLELEPVDADEASMLLEGYPLSRMKPKP